MKEYIKILSVFKVAAYIFSIWVHSPHNNSCNFGNNLEYLYNVEITSDIIFQRSLAKHVPKKELNRSSVRNILLENNTYKNAQCTAEDLSKYTKLKKKGLNDLDLYKKLYNHRYSKKNVLGKFDCYCEKKIFDKFDHIKELKEKLQHDKRSFNKKFNQMLTFCLILFGIVPLLGVIMPLLKNEYFEIITWCFTDCDNKEHYVNPDTKDQHKEVYKMLSIDKNTWNNISFINFVFWCTTGVIIICVLLYIFIKIIKYKKLKSGRDKMSLKEYYHFTKSLL